MRHQPMTSATTPVAATPSRPSAGTGVAGNTTVIVACTGAAIALSIWCAAVVGTVDNLLRPTLVGKDTQIPDLLILIGTLGGLTLFGAAGLILGPIVVALFITIWEIYGSAFRDMLQEPAASEPGP
mgnify:CR=1 FL=1